MVPFAVTDLGAVSILWALLDPKNGAVTLGSGLWILVFGGFVFGGAPYLQTRSAMKNPNFASLMTFTNSENGIDFTGEHASETTGWPMVKSVSEMRHAILINLKKVGFQIIPKRQISEVDITAFKSVLRTCAPGAKKLATF